MLRYAVERPPAFMSLDERQQLGAELEVRDAIDDIRFTLAGRVLDRGGEELLNPFRAARIHLPRKASRPTARQLTVEPRARECPVAFDRCRRCPGPPPSRPQTFRRSSDTRRPGRDARLSP